MKFQKIFLLIFCLNTAITFAQNKAELSTSPEDDNIQKFLKEKKLVQKWKDISSTLLADVNNKNNTQSQKKPLLSEETKQKSQSKYFNEGVLFRLVAGGYTIDIIENLTAQGLPVLDIFYGTVGEAIELLPKIRTGSLGKN